MDFMDGVDEVDEVDKGQLDKIIFEFLFGTFCPLRPLSIPSTSSIKSTASICPSRNWTEMNFYANFS